MDMSKSKIVFQDYIAIIFTLVVSGGFYFFMGYALLSVPAFFVFTICYRIRVRSRVEKQNVIVSLLFLIIYFVSFIRNGDYSTSVVSTTIVYSLFSVSMCMLFSSISYDVFREVLIKIVFVMAVVSITLEILVEANVVYPNLVKVGELPKYTYLFHVFGNEAGVWNRMAGIYWEPGAYQIVLCTTLFFLIDGIHSFKDVKVNEWMVIVTLVVAVVLTRSTAGYFVLMILLVLLSIKYLKNTKYRYVMIIPVVSSVLIGAWFLFNSEAVASKLDQEGKEGTSYMIRYNDNMAMLQMIGERPILGYGLGEQFNRRSNHLGNETSSNGILKMTSNFGFVYLLVVLVSVWLCAKQFTTPKIWVLLFFLTINSFEVFFCYPLMGSFLFLFGQQRHISDETN